MITRPNLCGWFESDLGDPQKKDARRKEKVMANRGNSKAGQKVKQFCKRAATTPVCRKKNQPEEDKTILQATEVAVAPTSGTQARLSLRQWIEKQEEEQKKKNLLAIS